MQWLGSSYILPQQKHWFNSQRSEKINSIKNWKRKKTKGKQQNKKVKILHGFFSPNTHKPFILNVALTTSLKSQEEYRKYSKGRQFNSSTALFQQNSTHLYKVTIAEVKHITCSTCCLSTYQEAYLKRHKGLSPHNKNCNSLPEREWNSRV